MVKRIVKYVDKENGEHLSEKGANQANKAIDLAAKIAAKTNFNLREARLFADFMVENYTLTSKPVAGTVPATPTPKKAYVPLESALVEHSGR